MSKDFEKGISSVKVVLDRIEEGQAVFLDDDYELIIPKKILPKELKEGDAAVITVSTDKAETERCEKKAKEILNEILNF